jgi:2'-5' RNA ligase
MRQFVVIAPIETVTVGRSYAVTSFPLHVTHVPPFHVRDEDAIAEQIAREASATERFDIVGESTKFFGPNADIPVTLVSPEPSRAIHLTLIEQLQPLDWIPLEIRYSKGGFVAHITKTQQSEFEVGARAVVESFALVELGEIASVTSIHPLHMSRVNAL